RDAEVREQGAVAACARTPCAKAVLVVDADLRLLDRAPDGGEGEAPLGEVEGVEAGVDVRRAIVFVFLQERDAAQKLHALEAPRGDGLEAEGVDIDVARGARVGAAGGEGPV